MDAIGEAAAGANVLRDLLDLRNKRLVRNDQLGQRFKRKLHENTVNVNTRIKAECLQNM